LSGDSDDISEGATHKFLTTGERAILSNTSGTNSGDQDLTGLVPKTTTVNGHALSINVTITLSDVGLSDVDNTSDLDKPISDDTQNALDSKANSIHTHIAASITNFNTAVDMFIENEKGQNDGLASLDSGGKVPASQLPSTVMEFKGT